MRRLILAALGAAATLAGVSAADAQPYWGGGYGGYGRAEAFCQRQASRAWGRHEFNRIFRHCIRDVRRAERDRWRYERRYRGYRGW